MSFTYVRQRAGKVMRAAALAGLAVTMSGAMSACASTYGGVYVRSGPPAPMYERRVVAPGPGYIWVPGYYQWSGRAYYWTPGRYMRPPRPGARWETGRWAHNRNGWYFVDGRWR